MGKQTYRYNPQTCQYQPVRISAGRVLSYSFSLLFLSAVVFGCMVFAQHLFFSTDKERDLRKENEALVKGMQRLSGELASSEAVLTSLQQKDQAIHQSLFPGSNGIQAVSFASRNPDTLLTASYAGFLAATDRIQLLIAERLHRSNAYNQYVANTMKLDNESIALLASLPSIQPIENPELTKLISGFGTRINPYHHGHYNHPGVDLAAPTGTPVFATASGIILTVKTSKIEAGWGNYVEIDHGNGFVTRYAHLDEITVKKGQRIDKKEEIGTVGKSGGAVAPHVHYEILRDGTQVNPVYFMVEGLSSTDFATLLRLAEQENQSLD